MASSRLPRTIRRTAQKSKETNRAERVCEEDRQRRRVREEERQRRAQNRKLARINQRNNLEQPPTSEEESIDFVTSGERFERAVGINARRLTETVSELTSGRGLEFQKAVLDRFLDHPLLEGVLPLGVVQRRELQQCRVVCNGLFGAWSILKYASGKDMRLARNVIEAGVISLGDDQCAEAAGACVGMNKRTLRRAVARRRLLNEGAEGEVWAKVERKRRKDALPQHVVDAVISWWTSETRVSPSKRDVRRKRVGVKRFIYYAGHWLEDSQVCTLLMSVFLPHFVVVGHFAVVFA